MTSWSCSMYPQFLQYILSVVPLCSQVISSPFSTTISWSFLAICCFSTYLQISQVFWIYPSSVHEESLVNVTNSWPWASIIFCFTRISLHLLQICPSDNPSSKHVASYPLIISTSWPRAGITSGFSVIRLQIKHLFPSVEPEFKQVGSILCITTSSWPWALISTFVSCDLKTLFSKSTFNLTYPSSVQELFLESTMYDSFVSFSIICGWLTSYLLAVTNLLFSSQV